MKILMEIAPQRIADIMTTACEQNDMTGAWCAGIRLAGALKGKEDTFSGPWYADPTMYSGRFTLEIYEIKDESKTPDIDKKFNVRIHKCTQVQFANGLQLMAMKHGRHFGDFMSENEDNITADVFLQCVALGDLVYG